MSAKCQERTHAARAQSLLSATALQRLVHKPLGLDRKRVSKGHLTLRHDQACSIRLRRNPPLSACRSGPKELASCILMVEHRRLQYQRSGEPVPSALNFSISREPYTHAVRQLIGHHQLNRVRLEQGWATRQQASNEC